MSVLYIYPDSYVNTIPAARFNRRARMVFTSGDYAHACACHADAKAWADRTGVRTKTGLDAQLSRPQHEQSPSSEQIAPLHLMHLPGWSVSVEFYLTEEALAWLQAQPLPEHGRLVLLDALGMPLPELPGAACQAASVRNRRITGRRRRM